MIDISVGCSYGDEIITMKIQENIPLAAYTTFKIGGPARFFCIVTDQAGLIEAVGFAREKKVPILVLGGGSNILVADAGFHGLAIKMEMKGVEVIKDIEDTEDIEDIEDIEDVGRPEHDTNKKTKDDFVYVKAMAGEVLDKLIGEVVGRGLFGLENLTSIPGTVGASPVQNISAYGQEIGHVVHCVGVLNTKTMKFEELPASACDFEYRDSTFKHERGKYIITYVIYRLAKNGSTNIGYKDLKEHFASRDISSLTPKDVRNAIVKIRSKKFPDWSCWGTAGSFFKNPIISKEEWVELEKKYPDMPHFVESDGRIKVALGWILDKLCDAKGLVMGNVSTFENQALVVVAKPGATASEVVALAQELIKRVKEKTGIEIDGEVEWAC